MAKEKFNVTGEQYIRIDGKILELKRQLRQESGCPFDPEDFIDSLQCNIEGKFLKRDKKFSKRPLQVISQTSNLKLISGNSEINLEATDGSRFISEAEPTFKDKIEENFKRYNLGKKSIPTEKTLVSVYESTKPGTGQEFFKRFFVKLDELVLTQNQIIDFCEKHPSLLCQNGVTLFLIKEYYKYFIVWVKIHSNGLWVNVHHFNHENIFVSHHYIVVPTQFRREEIFKLPLMETSHLELISSDKEISLDATDGSRFISEAKLTFESDIDQKFEDFRLNKKGGATEKTLVSIYESTKHGTGKKLFKSFKVGLERLAFTQHQVINFCEKHLSCFRDGQATLFLIKEQGCYFIVSVWANISSSDTRLSTRVARFNEDVFYFGLQCYRVIVPIQFQEEEIVKLPLAETSHAKLISGNSEINLDATDGSRFIYGSGSIFKSYINLDFKNYGLAKKGVATKKTPVSVYELVKGGTGKQIFQGFNVDLDKLLMTQHQIIDFCEKHPNWLRRNGHATLFLTKEGDNYFVIHVYVDLDGLRVGIDRLEDNDAWDALYQYRIIVPQLLVA